MPLCPCLCSFLCSSVCILSPRCSRCTPSSHSLLSYSHTRAHVALSCPLSPHALSPLPLATQRFTHTHVCNIWQSCTGDGLVRKCSKCQISFLRQSKGENKSPCREELITMYCYEMMKKRGKKKKEKRLRAIFIDEKQMFR